MGLRHTSRLPCQMLLAMHLCTRKTVQLLNTPEHISLYLSLAARKLTPMKHVSSTFMMVLTSGVYSYQEKESRTLRLILKNRAPILQSQLP